MVIFVIEENNPMKTFLLTLLAFCFSNSFAYKTDSLSPKDSSQKGFYIKLSGGYGFGAGKTTTDFFSNIHIDTNRVWTNTQIHVSLGSGMYYHLSGGYMFSENFGLETGVSYLKGSEYKASETFDYPLGGSIAQYSYDEKLSANMLSFNLSFLTAFNCKKWNFATKMGIVFGIPEILNTYIRPNGYYPDKIDEYHYRYYKRMALGGTASIEIDYALSKKFQVFSETTFNLSSYAPKHGTMFKYTSDGVDLTDSIGITEIKFVEHYDPTTAFQNPDEQQRLIVRYPMSSIICNVGIRFKF